MKTGFVSVIFVALLGFALPALATVNTFYYWHLGESDPGAVASGASTNTIDSVARFTLTNTPTTNGLGVLVYPQYSTNVASAAATNAGSSLSLQFSGGQYGSAAPIRVLTNNFGVELWVNPASNTNSASLVYNGNSSTTGWGLYQMDNTFSAIYGGVTFIGSTSAPTNTWTHLALVFTNGTGTFYANGAPVGSVARLPNPVQAADIFRIAANIQGGEKFNGLMDELRIFAFAPNQFSPTDLLCFNGATNLVPQSPVVYDSYGPNFSYTNFYESAGCSYGFWQAMPFSPTASVTLDHILLPLYFYVGSTGPNQVRFTLCSDVYTNSQHQPGATIETWLLSNISVPSGQQYAAENIIPTQSIQLTAGVQYWLVGSTDNPNSTTYWGINPNNPNLIRTSAISRDQGTNWTSPDGEINAAFQVYANPIPVITGISTTNANLKLQAANGIGNYDYVTLAGTNLSQPGNSWTPVSANLLTNAGPFTISLPNSITPGVPMQFYRLRVQ